MDEQATLNRFIYTNGTSLMEYATRLHNKELRIRDLPVEDKVAVAA